MGNYISRTDEHAQSVLRDLADPLGDEMDAFIVELIDETYDLRQYVTRCLSGEEMGPYADKVRIAATQYAYRQAREAV